MASTPIIGTEGTIPFHVDGETYQTWFKVFGDLTNRTCTPLLVLHGGPGYSHDYLLPISDLASSTSPVIFYDQLGNSRSTHLPDKPKSFWSIDLFIDELVNVLTYFNIQDEFDLLGHSWGGMLAVEFEIRRQHAGLRRIILSNSLAAMHLWNEARDQLKSAFPAEVQEGMSVGLKDLERFRTSMFIYFSVHGCTVQPIPEELKYSLGQFFNDDADRSVSNAMNSGELANWNVIDNLHLVRVQTLVVNGRADMAQDFVCAPFAKHIKNVKWVTFEGSSHTPMWEEREKYMELVRNFLSQ